MTLQELLDLQENNQWIWLGILLGVPLLAVLGRLLGGEDLKDSPVRYFFGLLVYAAVVPGMLAIAACVHLFTVGDGDFLQVNVLVYFLPILTMLISLALIHRFIPLSSVPGFGRLSGLLMVAGVLGLVIFFLKRTFIGLIFFGSIWSLAGFFAVLVFVFVVGIQMFSKGRNR